MVLSDKTSTHEATVIGHTMFGFMLGFPKHPVSYCFNYFLH